MLGGGTWTHQIKLMKDQKKINLIQCGKWKSGGAFCLYFWDGVGRVP